MARLPTVGGDDGNWGSVLNEFLEIEHNADGTHGLASGLVTDVVNTQSSVGSTYTLPAPTAAGMHYLTLTSSCTVTFPTAVAGQSFTLILKQGESGSHTVTWPEAVKWAGGTAPTLSTTEAATDVLGFFSPDGSDWFGFVSGLNIN